MAGLTLYQIEAEGLSLLNALDDSNGQLTPEAEAVLTAWEGALEQKTDGYCKIVTHFERSAEVMKAEADRLNALASAKRRAADYLKDRLKAGMERLGLTKIETPLFTASIQKNGGRPSVKWDGPIEELPRELQKVEVSLDKQAALEAWELGMAPAALTVERGSHLRIR